MPAPKFYKIDSEREVVLQGKSTAFITVSRDDTVMTSTQDLIIVAYPQPNTFETRSRTDYSVNAGLTTAPQLVLDFITSDPSPADPNEPGFNRIAVGQIVKNWEVLDSLANPINTSTDLPFVVSDYFPGAGIRIESLNPASTFDFSLIPPPLSVDLELGYYGFGDGDDWYINGADSQAQLKTLNNTSSPFWNVTATLGPFDGTTPYIFHSSSTWVRVPYSAANTQTNGASFRIDYTGENNSHLKFNLLMASVPAGSTAPSALLTAIAQVPYGLKSVGLGSTDSDYQEIHLFGYEVDYVRPQRDLQPITYPLENPIYDDRASYGLLKTNPKLSGNVKLTVDSSGELWMNSFDANDELADSSYKKFSISSNSTYSKDLYSFFKNGKTPTEIIFDLYQVDNQYLNTKRTYDQQYDNFYNYGVEQLRSKFYDENFTFLAPIWLRKTVPDYFIVFRVNHPLNVSTYEGDSTSTKFVDFFEEARIVKTFDLRSSSKVGAYLRNIANDSRFRERPIEVSWEADVATYWNGVSYKNGTMTSKGEFLYDYFTADRPIKELESFVTSGFERNGIISTNLINMEFLFDDDEAPLYGINRYFGFYVTENQLAEFEIEPSVLGKISGQTPKPKLGVDGQPYSLRPFIQTNPAGIQIPVHYYHNTTFTNNTSNIPEFQGFVQGKFPLPSMVDDPLRFFYVKDRNDVFKRVNKLSEINYGTPNSDDYIRATQLQLFDNQEDISAYAGVSDITSQFPATLLGAGSSQLRLHLFDQFGTGVLENDEELLLQVIRYNDDDENNIYHLQVSDVTLTTVTVQYFQNQTVVPISALFVQPAVGGTVNVVVPTSTPYFIGQQIYIVNGGYYKVSAIINPTTIEVINLGTPQNVAPLTNVILNSLLGTALSGEVTYVQNLINTELSIDNYLTLDLINFSTPYVIGDAWRVEAEFPALQKFTLVGARDIDAKYRPAFQQFTWRLVANPVGLQPGDAWDYPVLDPNGVDYLTNFSSDGTPTQVANAIAKAVNSFSNIPVEAVSINEVLYLRSKIPFEDGNSILFTRLMKGNSYYANLGFYDTNNVNRQLEFSQKTFAPLSSVNLNEKFIEEIDQPTTQATSGFYLWINRTPTLTVISGRIGCDPSTYASATTTGTVFFTTTSESTFKFSGVPFSLDLLQVPLNTPTEVLYSVETTATIQQYFVGGVKRLRNRARINLSDGENYYSDRRITRTGNLSNGSSTITNIDTAEIYVGSPIAGVGIPKDTIIVDVNASSLIISKNATQTTSNAELRLGSISILNSEVIYQQWYQAQKGLYSRMKEWDIQGKYVYSLPYLDNPVYDKDEFLSGFDGLSEYSIIQLQDTTQEFYISNDKRVVAYKVYRPILGIFSIFPIKEFDFDFVFSDYSYTPTLEAIPYFFKEELDSGDMVELPLFENFFVTQNASSGVFPYDLTIQAYNYNTKNWYTIEVLEINNSFGGVDPGIIVNTFYPFYDYDPDEIPFLGRYNYLTGLVDSANTLAPYSSTYQNSAAGERNYNRRYLQTLDPVTKDEIIFYPDKFRVIYNGTAGGKITIENYNYSQDLDLKLFNGFAGIQDITGIQDAGQIQSFKDEGKFIEAFTYQLLLSEYDRLRENFSEEFAVTSKVVPFINKWVQEGTDARDNYYRLDNSMAFGISNLSPNYEIDFAETSVLTHEFPYLDSFPKDYPNDALDGSRSYMFSKLSDTVYDSKTWYDLLTSDSTQDWFTKYFSLGYPTEETNSGDKVGKSRDERFTFFTYNSGLGKSQTLFRGAKIQALAYDDTNPLNILEIVDSNIYNTYKFASIVRFLPHEPYSVEKPVDIEIIRNDVHKYFLMIVTIRIEDYRYQHGHADYMSQYFINDLLKTNNQQQLKFAASLQNTNTFLRNFLNYTAGAFNQISLEDNLVARPRQGFMGGGYLQLADKKIGGLIDWSSTTGPAPLYIAPNLYLYIKTADPTYLFSLQSEIAQIENLYRIPPFTAYKFLQDPVITQMVSKEYGINGNIFSFHTTLDGLLSGAFRQMINQPSSQSLLGLITQTSINYSSASITPTWLTTTTPTLPGPSYAPTASGIIGFNSPISGPPFVTPEVSTILLEGGTSGFESIKNYITFGNIQSLVNENSPAIEYYKIVNGAKVLATDFRLKMIAPDSIIKTNILHYTPDEDKPEEYLDVANIGYNLVNTNEREYLVRHRGYYEPKSRDILNFWVREDNSVSNHYEKDFLLSNTHIDNTSGLSGFIRNYGINKVATSGEVLKISRGSSYKSLYPLIGEVSVDNWSRFALDSSWDNRFYRNYLTTTSYLEVEGIVEMKELKSFLASKAMNIPKSFDLETFTPQEVTFNLEAPAVEIGVDNLVKNSAVRNQSKQDASKPKLTIRINIRERLLRKLTEDITSGSYTDEFANLQTYAVAPLNNLTTADINLLRTTYLEKNIINLYEVAEISLYFLNQQGIDLVTIDLTDAEKIGAGYKVDKDCVVRKIDEFIYEITKTLDPKVPSGYSISTTVNRI